MIPLKAIRPLAQSAPSLRRRMSRPPSTRVKWLALAATLAGLAGSAIATTPALAANGGNVYLVVFNSHCVGGGSVSAIYGSVGDSWTGGDSGDNIIYPYVYFNQLDEFNGYAICSRPWYQGGNYRINVVGWDFRPTARNQTFYF